MEIGNLESQVQKDIDRIGNFDDDNVYETLREIYSDSESHDGIFVLTTNASLLAKEPLAPGEAKEIVALFPARSFMVPLFRESAEVDE